MSICCTSSATRVLGKTDFTAEVMSSRTRKPCQSNRQANDAGYLFSKTGHTTVGAFCPRRPKPVDLGKAVFVAYQALGVLGTLTAKYLPLERAR